MHEEASPLRASRVSFTLSNLIVVMWELQINASRVNVKLMTKHMRGMMTAKQRKKMPLYNGKRRRR